MTRSYIVRLPEGTPESVDASLIKEILEDELWNGYDFWTDIEVNPF